MNLSVAGSSTILQEASATGQPTLLVKVTMPKVNTYADSLFKNWGVCAARALPVSFPVEVMYDASSSGESQECSV